jgi:hypothetical protein
MEDGKALLKQKLLIEGQIRATLEEQRWKLQQELEAKKVEVVDQKRLVDETRKEAKELRTSRDQIQSQNTLTVAHLESRCNTADKKVAELVKKNDDATAAIKDLRNELGQKSEQLKKAEADFAKTKKQAEQLDVAKKAAESKCSTATEELNALKAAQKAAAGKSAREKEIAKLQEELEEVTKSRDAALAEANSERQAREAAEAAGLQLGSEVQTKSGNKRIPEMTTTELRAEAHTAVKLRTQLQKVSTEVEELKQQLADEQKLREEGEDAAADPNPPSAPAEPEPAGPVGGASKVHFANSPEAKESKRFPKTPTSKAAAAGTTKKSAKKDLDTSEESSDVVDPPKPAAKTTAKGTPKVVKAEPKAGAKSAPAKKAAKATPKSTASTRGSKSTSKVQKGISKATPKKAASKSTAATPKATSKSTSKATSKATPKATPKRKAGSKPSAGSKLEKEEPVDEVPVPGAASKLAKEQAKQADEVGNPKKKGGKRAADDSEVIDVEDGKCKKRQRAGASAKSQTGEPADDAPATPSGLDPGLLLGPVSPASEAGSPESPVDKLQAAATAVTKVFRKGAEKIATRFKKTEQ